MYFSGIRQNDLNSSKISLTLYKSSFTRQGRGHPSLNVPLVPFKIASCVFANKAVNRSTFYIRPRYVRASSPQNGVYLPEELFYRYIVSMRTYYIHGRRKRGDGGRVSQSIYQRGRPPKCRYLNVFFFLDTYYNLTFFIWQFTLN